MTSISIIGSGNMAAAIGTRAAAHGHSVEILARNETAAQVLAERIGHGTTIGSYGSRPAGDIVVIAVLYQGAVDAVEHFGDALAGKVLVDITNPFNADASGVVTTPGDSMAERIAAAAPADASVVKAFNTIFGGVIAADEPLDVFFAGGTPEAKQAVSGWLASMGTQARDAGGIGMAYALEWAGILLVGLAGNGAGFDSAFAVR
jgi:8-hydroxy-5-deazaflavin:NADPH oxidoreductase